RLRPGRQAPRPDAGRLAPAGARRAAGDPSSKHGAEDDAPAATAQVTSPHDSRALPGAARDRNDIVVPQSGVNRARPAPGPRLARRSRAGGLRLGSSATSARFS